MAFEILEMDESVKSISLQDFPYICRICMCRKDFLHILQPIQIELLTTFCTITNNEVEYDSNLPKKLCDVCSQKLEEVSLFISLCAQSGKVLNKILEDRNKYIKSSEVDIVKNKVDIFDRIEVEVGLEVGSVDNDKNEYISANDTDEDEFSTQEPFLDFSNVKKKPTNQPKKHTSARQLSTCDICGKSLKSRSQLVEHKKNTEACNVKSYKCTKCDKAYYLNFRLTAHMKSHANNPFECPVCFKQFKILSNLRRHDKSVHQGLKEFKCDICGKDFARLERKINHMYIHTNECPHVCSYCGQAFKHRSTYRSHVIKHKIKNGEISVNDCSFCQKVFDTQYLLQSHIAIHTEDRKFLCNICGKRFFKKSVLDVHIRTHSGEKPFECKYCGKKFKFSTGFKTHVSRHTGERTYKCDICLKAFKQSAHLKSHMKTHTGERSFMCNFCGKTFGFNSNLKTHLRLHTGETPYICRFCSKSFADSSSMKRHEKTHCKP